MGQGLRAEEIPTVEHVGQLPASERLRALRRFEADLTTHRITQDGCPVTRTHMMNARKVAKTLERYGLAKPQQNRKIDAAVTGVLAHEAACDARAAGCVSICSQS